MHDNMSRSSPNGAILNCEHTAETELLWGRPPVNRKSISSSAVRMSQSMAGVS